MTTTGTHHSIPSPRWVQAYRSALEGNVLVVTGAGVSAESGIPTFRSVDGTGIYESGDWNPIEFLRSDTVFNDPERLWKYYLERFRGAMKGAKPNPGHYALAEFDYFKREAPGEFMLVTQNIDGLHIEAGKEMAEDAADRIFELHGNKQMRCSDECWLRNNNGVAKLYDIPENAQFPEDLTCPDCGSLMRPHVLLFDERYTEELYQSETVQDFATDKADLIITVGCSAVVPVAQILANFVVGRGGTIIDINPADESPLIDLAQESGLRLKGTSGSVLPQLVEFLTTWPPKHT